MKFPYSITAIWLATKRCVLCVAMSLWLLCSGCVSESKKRAEAPIVPEAPPSEFDTAANRPPNAKTLYSLSRILAAQGREPECMHVLSRIIDQYPEFLPAYNDLAEAHLRAEDTDSAMAVLTEGLMQAPHDPVLNNNMGMCWLIEGDYAQALDHFKKAEALAPKNPIYLANTAVALGMLGRVDEARENYDRVVTPADAARNMSILARARAHAADELAPTAPTTAPAEVESQSDAEPTLESQL